MVFRKLRRPRWLRRVSPALLWDGLMVYLAVLNILLIGFDLTYMWARPFYVHRLPWVARIYDPVKGVVPHPETERYVELADAARRQWEEGAEPRTLRPVLKELRQRSLALLEEDPFRLGDPDHLLRIEHLALSAAGLPSTDIVDRGAVRAAMRGFFSPGPELGERFELYAGEMRPLLVANHFRLRNRDGEVRDRFWLLDLPFLVLFAAELVVAWSLAARRRTYRRWYHYGLFHWYDVLGLVPWLRVFRVFRIASLYLRLRRSDLTRVGDDPVSRAVARVSSIVAEEISDMVTLRILSSAQQRIREGVYADIVRSALRPRMAALREEIVSNLGELLADRRLRGELREFLRLNLEHSLASAPALAAVPAPARLKRALVEAIGLAVWDSIVETLSDTLESEQGRRALDRALATVVDSVVDDLVSGDLEALIEEISYEVLARTKETVAVREWAGERWQGPAAGRLDRDRGLPASAEPEEPPGAHCPPEPEEDGEDRSP